MTAIQQSTTTISQIPIDILDSFYFASIKYCHELYKILSCWKIRTGTGGVWHTLCSILEYRTRFSLAYARPDIGKKYIQCPVGRKLASQSSNATKYHKKEPHQIGLSESGSIKTDWWQIWLLLVSLWKSLCLSVIPIKKGLLLSSTSITSLLLIPQNFHSKKEVRSPMNYHSCLLKYILLFCLPTFRRSLYYYLKGRPEMSMCILRARLLL